MCGRMRLETDWTEIVRIFDLDIGDIQGFEPHWNVAPTMNMPLLSGARGARRASWGSWGFVPSWERGARPAQRPINARCESIATNGLFKQAFAERRCAVPVTGFYEWETREDGKQPWLFARPGREVFVVAAVWSRWCPEGGAPRDTFCVLTTRANTLTGRIHDRMPVILTDGAALDLWLDPRVDLQVAQRVLAPAPEAFLAAHRVSRVMNSVRFDTAEACAVID